MELVIKNKKDEKIKLEKKVWELEPNKDLVAQVLNIYLSNQRKGSADVKTRGEVQGGGRKPWKQKGTGRARQGSIRSPLWYKGGVTFGPSSDRNWKRSINKKMNRKAIMMALSEKMRNKKVFSYDFSDYKEIKQIRNDILSEIKSGLVISKNNNAKMAIRNVKDIEIIDPSNINIFNILKAETIIFDKEDVKLVEENLLK